MAILTFSHLAIILLILKPVPNSKWHDLCLQLGVDPHALRNLKADKCSVKECLENCLSSWLDRVNVIDRNIHPSCAQLADALVKIDYATNMAISIRKNCDSKIEKFNSKQQQGITSAKDESNSPNVMLDDHIETTLLDDIKETFMAMNRKFAGILSDAVEKAVIEQSVQRVKNYFLAFESGVYEQLKDISDDSKLIAFFRNHCHLSNLVFLKTLVEEERFELPDELKLKVQQLEKERDKFYEEIKASEFAELQLKDHIISSTRKEVKFSLLWDYHETTLKEFEKFLNKCFKQYKLHISLHSVHHSLLTFVCTIPHWIVDDLTLFVRNKELTLHLLGAVEIVINGTVIITGPKEQCPWFGYWILQYVRRPVCHVTPQKDKQITGVERVSPKGSSLNITKGNRNIEFVCRITGADCLYGVNVEVVHRPIGNDDIEIGCNTRPITVISKNPTVHEKKCNLTFEDSFNQTTAWCRSRGSSASFDGKSDTINISMQSYLDPVTNISLVPAINTPSHIGTVYWNPPGNLLKGISVSYHVIISVNDEIIVNKTVTDTRCTLMRVTNDPCVSIDCNITAIVSLGEEEELESEVSCAHYSLSPSIRDIQIHSLRKNGNGQKVTVHLLLNTNKVCKSAHTGKPKITVKYKYEPQHDKTFNNHPAHYDSSTRQFHIKNLVLNGDDICNISIIFSNDIRKHDIPHKVFSTFDVQNVNFTTMDDSTWFCFQCIFIANSRAMGCKMTLTTAGMEIDTITLQRIANISNVKCVERPNNCGSSIKVTVWDVDSIMKISQFEQRFSFIIQEVRPSEIMAQAGQSNSIASISFSGLGTTNVIIGISAVVAVILAVVLGLVILVLIHYHRKKVIDSFRRLSGISWPDPSAPDPSISQDLRIQNDASASSTKSENQPMKTTVFEQNLETVGFQIDNAFKSSTAGQSSIYESLDLNEEQHPSLNDPYLYREKTSL